MVTRPVLIAATIPAPYMRGDRRLWASWLDEAETISASLQLPGQVRYLAICEALAASPDCGYIDPFTEQLGPELPHNAEVWTVALDDGRTEITTANRQRHIVMCQNLAADRAWETGADLFMVGAGISLPPDVLPRLLQLRPDYRHPDDAGPPLVGPRVPSYAIPGRPLGDPHGHIQAALGLPAGAVLIPWEALEAGLRWRLSCTSDDYGLMRDARMHGFTTLIRTDCVAAKYPEVVIPVEDRSAEIRRL